MRAASHRRRLLWAYCILLLGFLIAPIVIVMITSLNDSAYMEFPPRTLSLRWYDHFFASPQWTAPALLSLRIAVIVALCATTIGTLAAVGLRRDRSHAAASLEVFLISPMIVPVIVMALGLYFLFSATHLLDTPLALCLGHIVIATPLVIVLVRAGLRATDPVLELAARSLGARPSRVLLQITLPGIRESVAIAAVFAFLISFDEVVLAIFLGGPAATTLPKRMWETIQFEIDPTLTAISTLLTLAAIAVLAVAGLLRGQTFKPKPSGG